MKRNAIARLRKIARHLKSRLDRKALILMYHRVADVSSDPWALCVSPGRFAEQLEVLRKHARPVRLQQLIAALRNGRVPRRAVVITFDDGYADNLYNAKPLLERHEIPATAFIATGYLEQAGEFWWDELKSLLLEPFALPDSLSLSINGESHRWELSEAIGYGEDDRRRHHRWRAWEEAPTPRHSLYYSLWRLLQPLMESERRAALDKLRSWAGGSAGDEQARGILSPQEVRALAQGGLVEIGSHTVTHPVLSALPSALQRDEIQQSKAGLEEILGRAVTSFAYPYGGRSNYTDETVAIVRQAGYDCACSTLGGVIERGADSFQLPRVQVEDWDGEEFAQRLSRWFDNSKGQ